MLLLVVNAPSAASTPAQVSTILILGDSISAGYGIQRDESWVSLLAARVGALEPPRVVVNASVSGDTTAGALARLPHALSLHHPQLVLIELGGNDALRGYPVDSIQTNLHALVVLAKNAGAEVLLLGMEIPPNYGVRYTRAFHAIYPAVAEAAGAQLVPFLLDGVATNATLMQPDGIHPTAAAQIHLLENVWPTLIPLL